MPHIIVEYQDQAINKSQLESVLLAIHNAISESGLFKYDQIKTRAYEFKAHTNAGINNPYIHVQARIKSGRDEDNKKQLAKVILSAFELFSLKASVVTVEIIDMDRASYGKYVP